MESRPPERPLKNIFLSLFNYGRLKADFIHIDLKLDNRSSFCYYHFMESSLEPVGISCPETGQTLLLKAQLTEASFALPAETPQKWEPKSLNPRHREIMRRLLEGASNLEIASEMSISPQVIVLLRGSKLFIGELQKLEEEADFNVIKRAEALSNEALDILKVTMRQGKTEALKLRAADSILDRAGYGKIEKRVVGIVDGEAVIKEINRLRRERILGDSSGGNTIDDPKSTSRPTYVLEKQDNNRAAAD